MFQLDKYCPNNNCNDLDHKPFNVGLNNLGNVGLNNFGNVGPNKLVDKRDPADNKPFNVKKYKLVAVKFKFQVRIIVKALLSLIVQLSFKLSFT